MDDQTRCTPVTAKPVGPETGAILKVVLINPYELGRQPLALAEPAALLGAQGYEVRCIDLSQQKLAKEDLQGAAMVAVYLGMHTATRIAVEALPRIKTFAPDAHLCAYGLYAPMNETMLRTLGIGTILNGDPEAGLVELARVIATKGKVQTKIAVDAKPMPFVTPDRTGLPVLSGYASLVLPDGGNKTVGFTDTTRGCKHLCRHCPVVPVYNGAFRAIPKEVVMADIRQQIEAGARHISFGDHDFFNGPTHGLRIVKALHGEFPDVSYDAVIKIQHLLNHADLLWELKAAGCLFITAAVESIDDQVLKHLDKHHTHADFVEAVALLRDVGIDLAPTFIPFTPWTTLQDYLELLQELVRLELVESVPPVQLSIRLLVPKGSYLFKLSGFQELVGEFDAKILGYPWQNPDPEVDRLQQEIQSAIEKAEKEQRPRRAIFEQLWRLAHQAANKTPPPLPQDLGKRIAAMSEPWYCCAEPTQQQLEGF